MPTITTLALLNLSSVEDDACLPLNVEATGGFYCYIPRPRKAAWAAQAEMAALVDEDDAGIYNTGDLAWHLTQRAWQVPVANREAGIGTVAAVEAAMSIWATDPVTEAWRASAPELYREAEGQALQSVIAGYIG